MHLMQALTRISAVQMRQPRLDKTASLAVPKIGTEFFYPVG